MAVKLKFKDFFLGFIWIGRFMKTKAFRISFGVFGIFAVMWFFSSYLMPY